MRGRVLSEMEKFGAPLDPFAPEDGTVEAVQQIAEREGASVRGALLRKISVSSPALKCATQVCLCVEKERDRECVRTRV